MRETDKENRYSAVAQRQDSLPGIWNASEAVSGYDESIQLPMHVLCADWHDLEYTHRCSKQNVKEGETDQ